MAETKTILGGWYTHALPTKEYASLTPWNIETHLGPVDRPINDLGQPDGPLFIDITNVDGFRIAGKGGNSFITWEHTPDGVWHRWPDACGNYSVMYDLAGKLHISDCSIGTQGWRYIAPDGTLVPGDASILLDGINEFTDLGDGILIGQGNATGGVVVRIDGVKRVLAEGACYDIKARRAGNDVAISFYLIAPDGLSAHIWWGTVDELRQLKELVVPPPPPPPPPDPTMDIPQITVVSYDSELVSGKNWQTTFSTNGITFQVIKDAKDQLVITAVNAAGSTSTGKVRQLQLTPIVGEPVPVPKPPPVPEPEPKPVPVPVPVPARDQRFVYAPSPAAADLKDLFKDASLLKNIGAFQFYVQSILNDEPIGGFGPNGYNYLKEVFPKLRALGIATGVEIGAVKPEDCNAEKNTASLKAVFQRVADAGGKVDYLAMDEPLTANHDAKCRRPILDVANAVSGFIQEAKRLNPDVKIIWIEAWPEVSPTDIKAFYEALTQKPDVLRLDIEWDRAERISRDLPAQFIGEIKKLGLPISVLVNSTEDPIASDEAHDANLQALAAKIHGIYPDAPQVVVQSWAFRNGVQDVPSNLGEHGLLATFEKVRALFTGPVTLPPPQESKVLKSIVSEQPIVVKVVKPIPGTKLSTLILPDDKVYSCQPDGSDDVRPAGSQGQWEKCRVEGNLATFKPVEKTYFTKPFVETDEL